MKNLYLLETALEQIEAEISTDIAKIKVYLDDPSATPEEQDPVYAIHEVLHHIANHIIAKESAENLIKQFKESTDE